MIWMNLFFGGIALYSVETAEPGQPFHITAIVALAVCLLPTTLEAVFAANKTKDFSRLTQKRLITKSED